MDNPLIEWCGIPLSVLGVPLTGISATAARQQQQPRYGGQQQRPQAELDDIVWQRQREQVAAYIAKEELNRMAREKWMAAELQGVLKRARLSTAPPAGVALDGFWTRSRSWRCTWRSIRRWCASAAAMAKESFLRGYRG